MDYENIKILIDGVELPAPATVDVEFEDYDANSIRGINDGVLDRNRIRANVQKVIVSYLVKDLDDISRIYQMISPATFTVELRDDVLGERVTKKMYAGPKKHSYIRVQAGIKGRAIKFSLVEV